MTDDTTKKLLPVEWVIHVSTERKKNQHLISIKNINKILVENVKIKLSAKIFYEMFCHFHTPSFPNLMYTGFLC